MGVVILLYLHPPAAPPNVSLHRSGGLVYALCLALGVPPETAWAHLTRMRKRGDERFTTGVMSSLGGESFQTQLSVGYEQLRRSGGTDQMLNRTLKGYTVIPTWVAAV